MFLVFASSWDSLTRPLDGISTLSFKSGTGPVPGFHPITALRCLPLLANLERAPFRNWSRFPERETGPVPNAMVCAILVDAIDYLKQERQAGRGLRKEP